MQHCPWQPGYTRSAAPLADPRQAHMLTPPDGLATQNHISTISPLPPTEVEVDSVRCHQCPLGDLYFRTPVILHGGSMMISFVPSPTINCPSEHPKPICTLAQPFVHPVNKSRKMSGISWNAPTLHTMHCFAHYIDN